MKAATAKSPLRPRPKARKKAAAKGKLGVKSWTPPDFARRLKEDFGGKIMPFSYVDFLER